MTRALIVVDVQNDFADPQGSLYVAGGEEIVELVNDEIERAQTEGRPVFYTQDWHPGTTPHFEKDGGVWPVHCVMGTWGADFHPDLRVVGDVIRVGSAGEDGYSGFTMRDPETGEETPTQLGPRLREEGVDSVLIVGLATDYCVKETALDAIREGLRVSVKKAATRPVDLEPSDGERALHAVEEAGGSIE